MNFLGAKKINFTFKFINFSIRTLFMCFNSKIKKFTKSKELSSLAFAKLKYMTKFEKLVIAQYCNKSK